ncbi:MAG TPA: hypothetical protein VE997_00590 [Candidatus Limnocylindria bacterium]|nr:hypothetical protein [Candidatus Limnocylindria bacterium]
MRMKTWVAVGVLACASALGACGGGGSSSSSESSGGSDVAAFCANVKELKSLKNPFAGLQPGDVQGAKDAIVKLRSEVASVGDVAPAAISSDVEAVERTFADFASSLKNANTPADFLKAAQDFQAKANSLKQTVAHLNAYTKKNCGS